LVLGLVAGAALGWIYFQALWATLEQLPSRHRPGLWIAASLFLRLGLVLAAFVWLVRWGGWAPLVAALLGLIAARAMLVKRFQPPPNRSEKTP
jgi:F1F0 ATPase subunit 2